jgi:hypothetical protein
MDMQAFVHDLGRFWENRDASGAKSRLYHSSASRHQRGHALVMMGTVVALALGTFCMFV